METKLHIEIDLTAVLSENGEHYDRVSAEKTVIYSTCDGTNYVGIECDSLGELVARTMKELT